MKELISQFVETRSGVAGHIFAENRSSMIEISKENYQGIARTAAAAIAAGEFFSGTVEYVCPEFSSELTATLLVYRREEQMPEGLFDMVHDIVPVWWEFSTVASDGSKVVNGFSFAEFRSHFIDYCRTEVI